MHDSVMKWVAEQVEKYDLAQRSVLDIGSYDVNGSTKPLFDGVAWLGVDSRNGPNVDVVAWADDLPFADEAFEVVTCTEMLEHDPRPWKSIPEMARVLQSGGYLLLTCRGFDERGAFPLHTYPDDIWRFTGLAVTILLSSADLRVQLVTQDPEAPGVFAVARKR